METALASATATAAAAAAAIVRRFLAATTRYRPALVFTDRPFIVIDGLDERQVGIVDLGMWFRRRDGLPVLLRRRLFRGNVA
ncbi:hypothetical protein D3C72_1471090 [compost metagenome]